MATAPSTRNSCSGPRKNPRIAKTRRATAAHSETVRSLRDVFREHRASEPCAERRQDPESDCQQPGRLRPAVGQRIGQQVDRVGAFEDGQDSPAPAGHGHPARSRKSGRFDVRQDRLGTPEMRQQGDSSTDAQLHVDAREMGPHRRLAQREVLRNLARRDPRERLVKHRLLSRRERGEPGDRQFGIIAVHAQRLAATDDGRIRQTKENLPARRMNLV
jgi:hypothetical protein